MEHTKEKLTAEHQNLRGCIRKTLATLGEQIINSDNVTGDAVERIQTLVKLQMTVCESESALSESYAAGAPNTEFVRAIEDLRVTKYGDGYKPELGPLSFLRDEVESYKVSAPQEGSDEVFELERGANGITVKPSTAGANWDFGQSSKSFTVRPLIRSPGDADQYRVDGWLGAPWVTILVDGAACEDVFEFCRLCGVTPYLALVHLGNIWANSRDETDLGWEYGGHLCKFVRRNNQRGGRPL